MRAFSVFLAACTFTACQEPGPLTEPDARSDAFAIVLSEFPAEPDLPPLLDGDTLQVRVAYQGDCKDHDFTLDQRVQRDTTVLTIFHDAHGDDCTGRVYDELRFKLPEPLADGPVVLKNPEGGVPFVLVEGRVRP